MIPNFLFGGCIGNITPFLQWWPWWWSFFNAFISVFFYTTDAVHGPYGPLLLHSNLPFDKTIAGSWHCSTVAILIRLIVRKYMWPPTCTLLQIRQLIKEIHTFTVPKVNNSPKSDHFGTGWRMIQVIGVHSGHRTCFFPPYFPLLSSMGSPAYNGYFRGAKKRILNQKQV